MLKLKTRRQFQAVLAGERVASTPHFALHRRLLETTEGREGEPIAADGSEVAPVRPLFEGVAQPWIGAMVPKRWARRAVTRNTIRRQIYAAASLRGDALLPAAHLIRLRSGFDRKQFRSATSTGLQHAVRVELEQLFARAARAPSSSDASARP